jgi:hypothetical protein
MVSMRTLSLMACFVSACLLLGASADSPDPDAIFLKARQVWDAQAYPTRIDYIVAVRVVQNGVPATSHYAGEYAPMTKDLHVVASSDEQLAQAHVPEGINVRLTRESYGKKSISIPVNSEAPADFLGVPLLEPTYSFGLAHLQGPLAQSSAPPVALSETEPGIIGTVVARGRTYAISYAGEEDSDQGRVRHLVLKPLRDPGRYRLRELWIETTRYLTVKAVTEGNFTDGPGTHVSWTTTFRTIDGCQYIQTEKANGPLKYGAQKFEEASISFEQVQAHHGMPPPRFLFSQLPIQRALTEPKQ